MVHIFVRIAMVPMVDVAPPLISYDGGTRCNITVEETEEGRLVPDVDRALGKES